MESKLSDFEEEFLKQANEDEPEEAESEVEPEPEAEPEPEPEVEPEAEPEPEAEVESEAEEDKSEEPEETPEDRIARLEKENKEWQHKFRSDAGRVGALQRKLNDQEARIQELMAKKESPTPEQVEAARQDSTLLKELAEDYPDIAKAMEAQAKLTDQAVESKLGPLVEKVRYYDKTMSEQMAEIHRANQVAALEKPPEAGGYGHPDWRSISESSDFQSWMSEQHPNVQSLVGSDEAADAAYVLDLFKRTKRVDAPPKPNGSTGDKALAQDRRNRNLAKNTAIPSTPGGPAVGPPDDFERAFEFFVTQDKR